MLSKEVTKKFHLNDGALTTHKAEELGINKETLRKAYKRGDLLKEERGIYQLPDYYYDELYIKQKRFSKGIYSRLTAVYLYNYGTYIPHYYDMTFPNGYHSENLINNDIHSYYVDKELHQLGVTIIETMFGNKVQVYDKEKTIVDLFSTKSNIPLEIDDIMDDYLADSERDFSKLEYYAKVMNKEHTLERLKSYV